AAFLIGLTAHALIAVLARAFYARQDTRTPVAAAVLAVVVNSSLAAILVGPLGLPGLGLAIAVAAWLEAIVLFVLLKRSLPELAIRPIASLGFRSLAVAIGGGLAAAGVGAGLSLATGEDPGRAALIVRIGVVGVVWVLTSAAISAVLRIGELAAMIGLMLDLVRRELPERAGRVSHLRIDPEIERDGPLDQDGATRRSLRSAGWRPASPIQPNATRIIDLTADEDALWGDLRKKWRQYVNKARNLGITVSDADGSALPEFY